MGVRVGVANFLDQYIGIDETNTFQLKFFIYHESCGRHRFSRFVAKAYVQPNKSQINE